MSEYSCSEKNTCISTQISEQCQTSSIELDECPCYKEIDSKCPCMKKKLVECSENLISDEVNQLDQNQNLPIELENHSNSNFEQVETKCKDSINNTVKGNLLSKFICRIPNKKYHKVVTALVFENGKYFIQNKKF